MVAKTNWIMRNCYKVICEMLSYIPKSETKLISDLNWNKEDSRYKAPEEVIQWQRTAATLRNHFEIPKENWQFKILSIFSTKSVEELKTAVEELGLK